MIGEDRRGCQNVIVGRFDVAIDMGGSFTLPEEWQFMVADDRNVCLMPDPQENCLLLLTKETLDDEVARLKRSVESDARLMIDQIAKNAHVFSVGKSGQIVIPAAQREYANIRSSATLLGCVRVAKVWASEVLNASKKEDSTWDFIEAAMRK